MKDNMYGGLTAKIDTLYANDDLNDRQTFSCTATNAGTNDYRAGVAHGACTQHGYLDNHDCGLL